MKRSLELARMNLRVGLMALGGFLVLVWVLFFPVRGASFFTAKILVKGYFERVDSLRRNAPVYYRGTEVGEVKSVKIVPERAEAPMEVVCSVEKRILPLLPRSTSMDIVALGLLGDMFIELKADEPRKAGEPLLGEGDVLASRPYDSVLAGMNGLTDRVRGTLDSLNGILAQVNAGQGSVGRVIHEDELYRELVAALRELKTTAARINQIEATVNEKLLDPGTKKAVDNAVASAQRVLESADQLTSKAAGIRWTMGVGLDKYDGRLYGASAGMRITPNKDRYYEGGVTYFNEGLTQTATDPLFGGYGGVNAFLGWRVWNSPLFLRGGAKRSSVAAGLDYRLQEIWPGLPLELSADAYHFGDAVSQFDLNASYAFLESLNQKAGVDALLKIGVDAVGNSPRWHAGFTILYDDPDLTSVVVKAKTGL